MMVGPEVNVESCIHPGIAFRLDEKQKAPTNGPVVLLKICLSLGYLVAWIRIKIAVGLLEVMGE